MNKKGDHKTSAVDTALNFVADTLDKTSSPSSRSGCVLERAARMSRAGVPHSVIALTLSCGSANGRKYSEAGVGEMVWVYEDNETRVNITKSQAKALIEDARDQQAQGNGVSPIHA